MHFQKKEIEIEEMERRRKEGNFWYGEIDRREVLSQREERGRRIEISGYNKWYKMVNSEKIPCYLKTGWSESRWRRIARFRLEYEVRESKYWLEEEKRLCRLCEWEEESWEHVWERCRS